MKTIKKVEIQYKHVEYIPESINMEDNIVYISLKYKVAIHKCLCGCGNLVVLPLNINGWNLIEENNKISFTPSIGNYSFECNSHYIITKNIANFV